MANNKAIQILRTNSDGIINSKKDIELLDGQPFYNKQKNYLTVGHEINGKVSQEPITVRELVGYFNDKDEVGNGTSTSQRYSIEPEGKTLKITNNSSEGSIAIEANGNSITASVGSNTIKATGSGSNNIEATNSNVIKVVDGNGTTKTKIETNSSEIILAANDVIFTNGFNEPQDDKHFPVLFSDVDNNADAFIGKHDVFTYNPKQGELKTTFATVTSLATTSATVTTMAYGTSNTTDTTVVNLGSMKNYTGITHQPDSNNPNNPNLSYSTLLIDTIKAKSQKSYNTSSGDGPTIMTGLPNCSIEFSKVEKDNVTINTGVGLKSVAERTNAPKIKDKYSFFLGSNGHLRYYYEEEDEDGKITKQLSPFGVSKSSVNVNGKLEVIGQLTTDDLTVKSTTNLGDPVIFGVHIVETDWETSSAAIAKPTPSTYIKKGGIDFYHTILNLSDKCCLVFGYVNNVSAGNDKNSFIITFNDGYKLMSCTASYRIITGKGSGKSIHPIDVYVKKDEVNKVQITAAENSLFAQGEGASFQILLIKDEK